MTFLFSCTSQWNATSQAAKSWIWNTIRGTLARRADLKTFSEWGTFSRIVLGSDISAYWPLPLCPCSHQPPHRREKAEDWKSPHAGPLYLSRSLSVTVLGAQMAWWLLQRIRDLSNPSFSFGPSCCVLSGFLPHVSSFQACIFPTPFRVKPQRDHRPGFQYAFLSLEPLPGLPFIHLIFIPLSHSADSTPDSQPAAHNSPSSWEPVDVGY